MSELYRGPLKLPSGIEDADENPLLIKFSSDLEIVFIGNILLRTKAPNAEPILLPLPQIHRTKDERWTCSFSACSAYIALTYNPRYTGRHAWKQANSTAPDNPAQLHIFRFNMSDRTYTCNTRAVSPSKYDKQIMDFHPYLPELVLCNYTYPAKGVSFEIKAQLMDLEKGIAITLESPTVHGDSIFCKRPMILNTCG